MTSSEIKQQLCDVMMAMEQLQAQFEQYGKAKQQLLVMLQDAMQEDSANKIGGDTVEGNS